MTARFRVVCLDRPATWSDEWLDWARRMGIDPNQVPVPSLVVCDDMACQVLYVRDVPGPDPHAREIATVQLEAPALAFPSIGYSRWAERTAPTPLDMMLAYPDLLGGTAEGTDLGEW